MNINHQEYRSGLPHQLHHNQCPPLQTFTARFPSASLETLNAVMIPSLNHEETAQYHSHIQSFLNNNRTNEQLLKDQQEKNRSYDDPTTSQAENNQFVPTAAVVPPAGRHCNQGAKNCIQCYTKSQATTARTAKIMVDAATMTDIDELEQAANWQNVAVTPNTKVAEYLTSLRQFLKLSTPSETKRKLGDVRIVTSPDGSRLYCCPECHMAYPDKSLLEPHLASHKIERRFVCGVCGAGLKRKEHLDRHQLSHSDERPYSCAACPKTFKRNEHLARHFIIHSGDKAQMERRFVCGVCGTGHARREHLERHQLAHTDDRPHACTTCRKTFKRNEHLARHLLTHSGLKPHICLECGKAFYRKDHLRKHLLAHQTKRIRLAGGECHSLDLYRNGEDAK